MKTSRLTFNIQATAETLVPDRFGRMSYLIGLGIVAGMVAVVVVLISRLPPVVPLFFTLPWGEARLAARVMLYLLPALALGIIIINMSLGRMAARLSPLLLRVLAVCALVVTIMLGLALVGIIQSIIL